jgi:hypothetical protein
MPARCGYGARGTGRIVALTSGRTPRATSLRDAANLIAFLRSAEGGWVNGQLLHGNGSL